jgi:hypothetical protein
MTKGSGDTLSEQDLFDSVTRGTVDLWLVHDADELMGGMFLQVQRRERGKALLVVDVVAASGHGFRQYAEYMLPRLREYAEMIGAYTIESVSRPGAARILSRLGCKPKAMIMELGNGRKHT